MSSMRIDRSRHRRLGEAAPPPAVAGTTITSPVAAPPLALALEYAARGLLAELETPATSRATGRASTPLLPRLSPVGAELLRWWCAERVCRTRVDNFNAAQRQALVHLLLAHEAFRSDDADTLHRRACGSPALRELPGIPDRAHHTLRLAPGTGLRWVLQALIVWRWAQAAGDSAGRWRMTVIAATPGIAARVRDALSTRDTASLQRHLRLFLPPGRRAAFCAWLDTAFAGPSPALRVIDATAAGPVPAAPLTLIAERRVGGATSARLRVDLRTHTSETGPEPLTSFDAARAIRRGAGKLPTLVPIDGACAPLPATPPRRAGLRPCLSRVHRAQLDAGLRELQARDAAFVALDPARRPRMALLCDAPGTLRAVRHWLRDAGFAADAVASAQDAVPAPAVRVVLDTLPPRASVADARVCVVVALRSHRAPDTAAATAEAILSAGAALLWPEPEFAELRAETLERAGLGRPPRHRLDVLAVIDDPRCRSDYDGLPHAPPAGDDAPATDDVFLAGPQAGAAAHDLALPPDCTAPAGTPAERLSDAPPRMLRRGRSLPVRKSVTTHAPCDDRDGGLRAAFLAAAEADPAIETHALLDPRRQALRAHEALLARAPDGTGWPEALVRTAERIYLIDFQAFCPTGPLPPSPGERALALWLRHVDALPPRQRDDRRWCRASLPAPLFWSWKRSGGALSQLLATLADASTQTRLARSPSMSR